MSLLSICQNVAAELGVRQPQAVVGSSDLTAQILLGLANVSGKHLRDYHDWQNLIVEVSFTSLATQEQTDLLDPDDYLRLVYNAEFWNTTSNQRFVGPTPQRHWRQLVSGLITAGTPGYWRIIGNQLNILPVLTAGDTISGEYISKLWCEDSSGTGQEIFMADTDVARVPENLIELEMTWRFRKSRGFGQYAEDMETSEREKEKASGRDRGTGRIRTETSGSDGPPAPTFTGTLDG